MNEKGNGPYRDFSYLSHVSDNMQPKRITVKQVWCKPFLIH